MAGRGEWLWAGMLRLSTPSTRPSARAAIQVPPPSGSVGHTARRPEGSCCETGGNATARVRCSSREWTSRGPSRVGITVTVHTTQTVGPANPDCGWGSAKTLSSMIIRSVGPWDEYSYAPFSILIPALI